MTVVFFIISLFIVVSALAVVLFRNPIHSALSLVVNLVCVAALFATLDAHFLAVVQIIVYAGAIMVLVVFVLMLLNLKIEKLKRKESIWYGVGALLALSFVALLIPVLNEFFIAVHPPAANPSIVGQGVSQGAGDGDAKSIGALLFTKYVFTFELASVLIMAALVGAVMLAKRNYNTSKV